MTVLSRCQRFDLRRVDAALLIEHLASIAAKERRRGGAGGAPADRARGGRLGARRAVDPRPGDRARRRQGRRRDRAGHARPRRPHPHRRPLRARDEAATLRAALGEMQAQHETGADPGGRAHRPRRVHPLRHAPEACARMPRARRPSRRRSACAAPPSPRRCRVRVLSRAWQMLLKGIQEVAQAPRPLAAADMVLVRLCHAADLPTPDEAIRIADGRRRRQRRSAPAAPPRAGRAGTGACRPRAAPPRRACSRGPRRSRSRSSPAIRRFEDVIATARAERDTCSPFALERCVRPVRFEQGQIEIALTPRRRAGAAAAARRRCCKPGPGGAGWSRSAATKRRRRRRTRRASAARPR